MPTIVERYISAYNAMDIEAMLATMHRDVIFEDFASGQITARAVGLDELRKLAEESKAMFSERRQTITAMRAAPPGIEVDVSFEGTMAVDLPNGIKAGERIELKGRSEYRFREGLIVYLADHS